MAEKVIHEVRFIETDDGFRIEVKGDKERMRELGFGLRGHRHGHHGPGFGFWRRHAWDFGPWWWGEPEHEEGEGEEPGKSEKN